MRCIRQAFYQTTARALAQEYGCVYAEDLKTKNMTKSAKGTVENPGQRVRQKSGLNRAILRTGFYGLSQAVDWQLTKAGGILEKVPPAAHARSAAAATNAADPNRLCFTA